MDRKTEIANRIGRPEKPDIGIGSMQQIFDNAGPVLQVA